MANHHHRTLKNKHPSVHYDRTYAGYDEAMNCWHVQKAANHHKVDLVKLAKALLTGIKITTAIAALLSGNPVMFL